MQLIYVVMNNHKIVKVTDDFRKDIASSACIYVSGNFDNRLYYAHSLQTTLEGTLRPGIHNGNTNNDGKESCIYCIAIDDEYYNELYNGWTLSKPESRGFYEILLDVERMSPVGYIQYSDRHLVQPFKCQHDKKLNQSFVFNMGSVKECNDTCLNIFLKEVTSLNTNVNPRIPLELKDAIEIPALKTIKSLKEICIDYVNNNFTLFLTAQKQNTLESLPQDLKEALNQDVFQSNEKTNNLLM